LLQTPLDSIATEAATAKKRNNTSHREKSEKAPDYE
jgi:hypothetical protein